MLQPFPAFAPDQSRYSPKASPYIVNAKPTQDGWGPIRALFPVSVALPAECRGACAVKSNLGVWQIFAGTARNLYRINNTTYAWNEISRTTDGYNLGDGEYWVFTRFGNYLTATAKGSNFPQYVGLDTSDDFANIPNANFQAETSWVAGDFLVFARIDGDDKQARWCGVNDISFWTLKQRGADLQNFPDGGTIQRGINQSNNAIIVQEDKIREMVFAPESGFVFTFRVLDPDRGTVSPESVVNIGPNDFIFLSRDGFFRNGRPIGVEKVDRWFFSNVDLLRLASVIGVADPFEKIVWFTFFKGDGTKVMLGYDWQLDRWCYSTVSAQILLSAATAGYSIDDLASFGDIDTIPYSLDSRFFAGGVPGFAGFDMDNKFGFFDGDNLEAILQTEEKQLNYPRRAITDRILVLVDTDDVQLAVAARENKTDTLNYSAYVSQEPTHPWISKQVSGRFHRFRARIPSGSVWTSAVGIDVTFNDGGMF